MSTDDIPPRVAALREAEALITGPRNATYGPPMENFTNTAEFWTTYLRPKLAPGMRVEADDVAWLMALLKAARNLAAPKWDNYVDAIGYIACGKECAEAAGKFATAQEGPGQRTLERYDRLTLALAYLWGDERKNAFLDVAEANPGAFQGVSTSRLSRKNLDSILAMFNAEAEGGAA